MGGQGHSTAAATAFALGGRSPACCPRPLAPLPVTRERAACAAGICVAGVALAVCGGPGSGPFGAYVAMLALFHQLEYICVAAYRADTLSFDCE